MKSKQTSFISRKDISTTPLVSIVIPSYNHAQFVQECIQSVIDQDYENIELIIIDDGSKDNSVATISAMVQACKRRFVRFAFIHRSNKGLCATLNEAIEWCQGKYVSCIASDDILLPTKSRYQVEYLERNPSAHGVFGGIEILNNATGQRQQSLKRSKSYSFRDIFTNRYSLPAPTQMLRMDSVRKVGGYREDLIIEDWSMWLALTEHGGTLDYIEKILAAYRRHDGNLSSRFELMQRGRAQILGLYKNSPLHQEACAMTAMVAAHDVQPVSKKQAFRLAYNAITQRPLTAFTKSFLWLMVKMFRR